MYALYNVRTKKFFVRENSYKNCVEVNTFIEATTFKNIKDAYYVENEVRNDYIVVDYNKAKAMTIFM